MASFNFGLLEFADGESGAAAVSAVVGKAKAEAASAKKAEAAAAAAEFAAAAGADKEKAALKNLYYQKLQHDYGVRSNEIEFKRLREALINLRGEENKLKAKGLDGRYLVQLSEDQRELRITQLTDEQRKLRQQQRKLRVEEPKLRQQKKEFYLEHGFLAVEEEEPQESFQGDNAGAENLSRGYNSEDSYREDSYRDVESDVGAYRSYERQVEKGYAYNNGGMQGYPERKKVWAKVNRPFSDAGTDADHKSVEKVTSDAGSVAEHKPVEEAAIPANDVAAPGSENSSAAGATASNKGQDGTKVRNTLSGSAKRKLKKKKKNGGNEAEKAKKQDSSEADVSKTDKEPLADYPREEEKMTLAEYEKMLQEKKKSSEDVSRTEQRKVSTDFEDCRMLEKKKLDDEEAVIKAEKVQKKAKETVKKEEKVQPEAKDADSVETKEAKDADSVKTKEKVVLTFKDLSFVPPRRERDGGAPRGRGRFNGGGFQGRSSHDNSTDYRAPAGRGGDSGRAIQDEAGNYGNGGAPRGGRGYGPPRGDYSGGRGDGGYGPRGDYSGGRGNGAPRGDYSGRGDGGNGAPRGDYSCGRGDAAQGGGYGGRGNGGYRNQGGNGEYQGGGGYQQYQRRPGNYNDRPRGRGGYSGNGRRTPTPDVKNSSSFPPLTGSAPARAAAPAAAPAATPAPSSAPAPAGPAQS